MVMRKIWDRICQQTLWFICPICYRPHYTIEYHVGDDFHHRKYTVNLVTGKTNFINGYQHSSHGPHCPVYSERFYWKDRKLDELLTVSVHYLATKNHDLCEAINGEYDGVIGWLGGKTRIRD